MSESQEQKAQSQNKDVPNDVPNDAPVADMISLMGDIAIEGVTKDMQKMIDGGFRMSLDGYVLALSRLMKHDTAWKCLVEAFSSKGESIPKRFYPMFGRSENDQTQVKRMFVV